MANITLDKMKTIVQSIVASVTRYKPNLSVNDPDDPRYVAGRLCYKAKKTVEEVPETTVTFAENNGLYMAELTSVPGVQAIGDVRTVVWDGVAYVCKAGDYMGAGFALGNRSLYNAVTGGSNPDTGEPFVWAMSPTYGISVLMTLDAAETHTVSCWADKEVVHTLPKEYLPQIPTDKLPDLGLAPVATSGSYNDLLNKPTIPTVPSDIVRYNTTQDLTTAQKTQARTNIGAGTSSFDGAYSSLTGAPTLATVATSGSYNDLSNLPGQVDWSVKDASSRQHILNRPFYEDRSRALFTFTSKQNPVAKFEHEGTGYFYGNSETGYSINLPEAQLFEVTVNGYDETFQSVAKKYKDKNGYIYHIGLGNAKMGADVGWIDANFPSMPVEDTGEPFFVMKRGNTANSQIVSTVQNAKLMSLYAIDIELVQLNEIFIPDSIQRVGQPLYLTDSAGAKWQLVVGTDGTLTATAVTE